MTNMGSCSCQYLHAKVVSNIDIIGMENEDAAVAGGESEEAEMMLT